MNKRPVRRIARNSMIRQPRRLNRESEQHNGQDEQTDESSTRGQGFREDLAWIWPKQILFMELVTLAFILYLFSGLHFAPESILVVMLVFIGLYWFAIWTVWRLGLTLWLLGQYSRGNFSARVIDRIFIGD